MTTDPQMPDEKYRENLRRGLGFIEAAKPYVRNMDEVIEAIRNYHDQTYKLGRKFNAATLADDLARVEEAFKYVQHRDAMWLDDDTVKEALTIIRRLRGSE